MANPFPFTSGQVLTAAQLNGIGEYAVYTPTFTNLTVGNGTLTSRFGRVQNFIYVDIKLLFGSTTSVSGVITWTLPVNATTPVGTVVGLAKYGDAGVGNSFGYVDIASSTTARTIVYNATSTYLVSTNTSSTVPFTWTTNDEVYVSFVYEAA